MPDEDGFRSWERRQQRQQVGSKQGGTRLGQLPRINTIVCHSPFCASLGLRSWPRLKGQLLAWRRQAKIGAMHLRFIAGCEDRGQEPVAAGMSGDGK